MQVKVSWAYRLISHPQWLALEETDVYMTQTSVSSKHPFTATHSSQLLLRTCWNSVLDLISIQQATIGRSLKGQMLILRKSIPLLFLNAYLIIVRVHIYGTMRSTNRETQHNVKRLNRMKNHLFGIKQPVSQKQ